MRGRSRTVEEKLARIARAQHGVVTRAQLLDAGVSARQVDLRVRAGALLREHRGVYRVGHRAPNVEARYLAAVLAGGEGALLSGPAAAHLFGLLNASAPPPEVTTRTERRLRGVKTRRSRDGKPGTTHRGIPITTVAQTLVDLSAQLPVDALARACHEAGVRYGTRPSAVEELLRRRPNAKGATKLHAVLRGEMAITLSKLEKLFIELMQEHGLPLPETNRRAGTKRVDCRWPDRHLTVELDSYRFHNSRHAWEQDRRREREAHARGDDFRRYTYGDVAEDPRFMLNELRSLLG
jgi:hypothetical protein